MFRAQSRVLGLTLALAGAFGPAIAHAQYGGGYGGGGGGYGFDFGGYYPGFDLSMMAGSGDDFSPDQARRPGKSGATSAPSLLQQRLLLVSHPAVQADLKLTEEQKTKLADLAAKRPGAGSRKPGSRSGSSATTSNRGPHSAGSDAQATGSTSSASPTGPLDEVLDPNQRKRLEQIAFQVEGPLAVARPDVAKKLSLSAAQIKRVRSIVVETRNQLAKAPPPNANPPSGADPDASDAPPDRSRFEQVKQAAEARLLEVLKPAQKEAFTQLLGPTFNLASLRATPTSVDAASPRSRGSRRSTGARNSSQ